METVRVADIAMDARSGGSDAVYSYRLETGGAVGDAYFVPLGTRQALGFAVRIYEATEKELGFPLTSLRAVYDRVEGLALPEQVIDLANFVAREYLCPLSVALTAATPPGARERLVTEWATTGLKADVLTPLQAEVLRTLNESGGTIRESKGKRLEASMVRALKLLRGKGLVEQRLALALAGERSATDKLLRLTPDEDAVEKFLKVQGRKKPAQALTLMRLQSAERSILTAAEIKAMSGVTDTTIKALSDAGLLQPVEGDPRSLKNPPEPNRHQTLAIDAVAESVHAREAKGFLLYGVTGSGKTEVYLRAAAEALRMGRQVLYLVPEIALATQAIAQLRERFGRNVAVLHSELPATERLQNFIKIRRGEIPVVLGARSAVFAPMTNLGLIIMDEEHEASYKQESSPRYHTKRLAQFLAETHGCPLILGSATPSVESFQEAEDEKITLLSLPVRAANAQLPMVHIKDLTEGYRVGQPSILCEELHERMKVVLEKGEQAILFLNRRAYAPFILCRDCGKQMVCPNCAVSLSFHRRDRRLRCHHCGFNTVPPDVCPSCGGMRISPFGIGTEKVEEAVAEFFPDYKIARLDRDIARRKGALEETLADFRSGATNVLVGTQMVAKGLDFPNVTLVGVIAADVSLNIPDFRSSERTFQLLSQVAGRAGRGQRPGNVIIQTFNPTHMAVCTAQTHDFLAFFEAIRKERQEAGYPPYKRLINIVLSGESLEGVITASNQVAELLQPLEGDELEILGPVDCAIERLQSRWRRHLLLKVPPYGSVESIGHALQGFAPKHIQMTIDVDPYTLM